MQKYLDSNILHPVSVFPSAHPPPALECCQPQALGIRRKAFTERRQSLAEVRGARNVFSTPHHRSVTTQQPIP